MPELPEVEVTRLSIGASLQGATVERVRLGKPLRWPLGCDALSLIGLQCGLVQRRGKYLWLPMLPGQGGLLMHLGMSGSLALLAQPGPPGRHDHFDLATSQGLLRLTDPRRFGAVLWSEALELPPASSLLTSLGLEPFDPALTAAWLRKGFQRRRAPIKQVLLAGDLVVGAGNIYACEALFAAGIDPRTPANRIGLLRAGRLINALRATFEQALSLGGSTLRDFRDAHGAAGAYQAQARVYGRAGQPCQRCGTAVRRVMQGQRSTFFCPGCQHR